MTNEHFIKAESYLDDASRDALGSEDEAYSLKAGHVHAMLAVAQEISDLHQTIGTYLEAVTNLSTWNPITPKPAFIDHAEAETEDKL